MRAILLILAAAIVALPGCYFPSQKFAQEDQKYTRFLDTPPALYCLSSRMDYSEKAADIETDSRWQKRLVGQLSVEAMHVDGEAGRIRFNRMLPKNVREAEALNLEGEAVRMRQELEGRRDLVGILDGSSAWYRRQAYRELRRIDQIMHSEIPTR